MGIDHDTYQAHFSPFLKLVRETPIPKIARPTPEIPLSKSTEARKLASLGFVEASWLQLIPVEASIAVWAPGRHAGQKSCRLGKKSRTDRMRCSAQKTKRRVHAYFP